MATPSEATISIKRITHVAVAVSDMERSVAFYRKVLGWKQIDDVEVDLAALAKVLGPNARCRSLVGRVANLGVELISGSFVPNITWAVTLLPAAKTVTATAAKTRMAPIPPRAAAILPLNAGKGGRGQKMSAASTPVRAAARSGV